MDKKIEIDEEYLSDAIKMTAQMLEGIKDIQSQLSVLSLFLRLLYEKFTGEKPDEKKKEKDNG